MYEGWGLDMMWALPGPTRPEPPAVVEVVVTITVSDRWTLCEWVTGTLRVCDEDRWIGRGDATVGIERLLACCRTRWWCSSGPRHLSGHVVACAVIRIMLGIGEG